MLSREQILALSGTSKTHIVNVKNVGDVGIRIMTGTEREAYEQQIFKDGKVTHEHLRAKLLAKVLCDADGKRMFTDDDIAAVSELPAPVVIALFESAQKLNSLTKDDVDELVGK